MDSEISMNRRAIEAKVNAKRHRRPRRVLAAAIKAYLDQSVRGDYDVCEWIRYLVCRLGLEFLKDLLRLSF